MKKQCKPISRGRWLALLLSALLLLGMLSMSGIADQAKTGKLTVKLKSSMSGSAPKVTLYMIGKADDTSKSGWSIYGEFPSDKILAAKTSTELGKIAKDIAKSINQNAAKYSAREVGTQSIAGGEAVFSNLSAGVYFGMTTGVPADVEVTPFIVTIPSLDPVSKKPIYTREVTLKEEWVTSATVKKVWEDEDDTYGIRPKFITVTLSNGTEVTLSPANNWQDTVADLPKYNQEGKEIQYTWTEAKVNGYELANVSKVGNVTTLTNVFVPTETPTLPVETPPPTTQVTGQKIWVDDSNAHKTRPEGITVTLYADGVPLNAKPTWTGTNLDTWTYTFANLPAVTANGDTIEYTVKEAPVEGYESEVNGTTITNKLIPKETKEFKELTGQKTWQEVAANDVNTAAANRPTYIVVHLLRDGVEVETRTVTAATNWEYSFGKQPLDDGYGNLYTYTLREDGVPGFFARIDGLNLINTSLVTPNNPPRTPGGDVPKRNTNTTPPLFGEVNEEQMEELTDMLDYNTPLWGQLLGTGDQTPIYPFVFGGIGALAIIALVVFGLKRKKKEK